MNIVDAIPADCGRKRRRPTITTQRTERCSDGDLSEIVVLALRRSSNSGDESFQSEDCCSEEIRHHDDKGTPCSTPPTLEVDEMMDWSIEKLLRNSSFESTSSSRLVALLEDNQRALQMLLEAKEKVSNSLKEDTTSSSEACTTTSTSSWKEACWFEVQHSLRGVVAMILYCVAHAATYELVSNLAYEAVEKAPDYQDAKTSSQPWGLYTAMLILGCLLARVSGNVWNYASPLNYKQVKLVYHNRIRLGAKDARFLHWVQQKGEGLLGAINLVSFYLCYIAVFFFVGQVAMLCDQRQDILSNLPSTLYQQRIAASEGNALDWMCPAEDYDWAEDSWLAANNTVEKEEQSGIPLDTFGPEDDLYFFKALSRNSYDNFFGQDYETPLFDSTHQILFFASVAAMAIYTLKSCLGYSFWAGW